MVRVSIIVPFRNEAPYLPLFLHSLEQQTFKNFEVVLLDDASTDAGLSIVRDWCVKDERRRRWFTEEVCSGGNPGVLRNYGARVSRGEVLVFLDADMILFPDTLERLVRPILNGVVPATTHAWELAAGSRHWYSWWFRHHEVRCRLTPGMSTIGVLRAVHRDHWRPFPVGRRYFDDRQLVPALIVDTMILHHHPQTFREAWGHFLWRVRSVINR
jgi:glycosyltransferase involved in cell wall biosynthesis